MDPMMADGLAIQTPMAPASPTTTITTTIITTTASARDSYG